MPVTFPSYPGFVPLFPQWISPVNGDQPPVYAWRAFTSPSQSITSSIATPRPLSDIPAGVFAIRWFASPPGFPIRSTVDYGDMRPYTFYLPDGTTRVNATNMSAAAYNQLLGNFLSDETYPA